jgi:predicted nucleic acid-binding protein
MRLIVDTNVLLSALLSPLGASSSTEAARHREWSRMVPKVP